MNLKYFFQSLLLAIKTQKIFILKQIGISQKRQQKVGNFKGCLIVIAGSCSATQQFMQKGQQASDNFFFSPLLRSQQDRSPYLSPFHSPFRKQSGGFEDLIDFKLEQVEECECVEEKGQEAVQESLALRGQPFPQVLQPNSPQEQAQSPSPSQACEVPSTKFAQVREQSQPPFFLLRVEQEGQSPLQPMIEFLMEHSHLKEQMLELQSRHFGEDNPLIRQAFKLLAGKFRKLRKTKEEMIKYCMRKAFKFVADRSRKDRPRSRDLDRCMKDYFQQADNTGFSIPFKKHSTEKTMNGSFLKRIFACQQFAEDYRVFLHDFKDVIVEDNDKKARYLAGVVEQAVQKNQVESIAKIKRLPWTKEILRQVYELAVSLPESPSQPLSRQPRRHSR